MLRVVDALLLDVYLFVCVVVLFAFVVCFCWSEFLLFGFVYCCVYCARCVRYVVCVVVGRVCGAFCVVLYVAFVCVVFCWCVCALLFVVCVCLSMLFSCLLLLWLLL